MDFKTNSSVQTKNLAKSFAQDLNKGDLSEPIIIALYGNLGSGKTTFIQGFLRELGVRRKITSPTFVLLKNYSIAKLPNYKKVYHFDCYRIKNPSEIIALNFKKIISNKNNIIFIEWPENIKKILPKNIIKINFKYGKKEHQRQIKISS
ncbi:MAG: tRNA (adenosine(37)-N6)-threonylcarbamoyltransferase complex ATPase subunit type 1 TsaE [Patescibacteria group bacterium]|nr:tRNA (adenosine(37)-N6)-threonylcarbamoyltransferase complex ATPase subunit type 1 TsaE [Patescibacteria group bacterium]